MLSSLLPTEGPATEPTLAVVRDVGIENFISDVVDASRTHVIVVNFWSQRSAASKQLAPVLEKVVRSYAGAVLLARIDVDQNPQIAQQMGVQSVPAVFAFYQGRPLDGFMGPLPEAQVKSWLEKLTKASGGATPVADGIDDAMKQAGDAFQAQDIATAHAIYSDILDADPAHVGATAGLLRSMIAAGELQAAKEILTQLPPDILKDKVFDAVRSALELAEQAGNGADLQNLKDAVAKDPADHQARFDLAMAHYAAGQREDAVDQLLESVKRARTWNEQAARKQLVKFFEVFGPTDPLTLSARKRLSSILFA